MAVENHIDVVEDAAAHVMCLAAELLLGDTRPEHEGPRNVLPLHDLLNSECRRYDDRLAGVVPFAVSRRARDEWQAARLPAAT